MYDDVVTGKVIGLSKKQRLWAESVFEKYKVGEIKATLRQEAKTHAQIKTTLAFQSQPKPLRPPGKE